MVVCPCPGAFSNDDPRLTLTIFMTVSDLFSWCFCMGDGLYSIECSCISNFVLIQHMLRTQVSDTGPMVLWYFLVQSSHFKHIAFMQTSQFDWLPWQPKAKFTKTKIKKFNSPGATCIEVIKLKLCRNVYRMACTKMVFSIAIAESSFLVAMATLKFPFNYNGKSANWHLLN